MELSIVLPAFNSRELARRNVGHLHAYLSGWCPSFEIVVVDDGSRGPERVVPGYLPPTARVIQL